MIEGTIDETSPDANEGANVMPTTGSATIDAPSFNKNGKTLNLEARSIKTANQAWDICKTIEQNNRTRAARTSDIQAIHDGEPPRSAADRAEKAKSWQSNASTNWMAGIVGRQAQRFVNAVISQPFLSFSRIPDSIDNWKEKSDLMQAKVTSLVRSWVGHTPLINSLAVENVLQGYTYAVFINPYTSKPKMYKQDRLYLPEQARQHASELQFFCTKEDYRLDEFLALFSDDQESRDAGYNVENCMKAANRATMQDPREDAQTTQFRKYVDMINEGTLGLSYTNTGERVVKVWILFSREYDGKVSMWMIDRDSGMQLRFSFKLFDKMEDVLTIFSFEPGNGCIHSSKGLGRKLAALAIMKELLRNGIIDNARIASLLLLQTDSKDRNRLAPQILSPFIYIDKNVAPTQTQFTPNADALKVIDQLIDQWAEQAVGAYLASQANEREPEKTATQATIESKREQEAADIQIRRWLDQWFSMIQIIQLRAFSDDNIEESRRIYEKISEDPTKDLDEEYENLSGTDPDTLRTLVEIMGFAPLQITDDEIRLFRKSPATVFAHVSDAVIQQGIESVFAQFKGDPDVDQAVLKAMVIQGRVGSRDAQDLIIPKADQTVAAEAARLQLFEANVMTTMFQPAPVSPRDNHLVHGMVLMALLNKMAPVLSKPNPPPQVMQEFELMVNHLGDHLNFAVAQKLNKDQRFDVLEQFYKKFSEQLKQVIEINAQANAAQHAVVAKIAGEGLPPQQQGASQQPDASPDTPPEGSPAGVETAQGLPVAQKLAA